jgi:hypothetical protein
MSLDVLDRKGKDSNGFCHCPQPAWLKAAQLNPNPIL